MGNTNKVNQATSQPWYKVPSNYTSIVGNQTQQNTTQTTTPTPNTSGVVAENAMVDVDFDNMTIINNKDAENVTINVNNYYGDKGNNASAQNPPAQNNGNNNGCGCGNNNNTPQTQNPPVQNPPVQNPPAQNNGNNNGCGNNNNTPQTQNPPVQNPPVQNPPAQNNGNNNGCGCGNNNNTPQTQNPPVQNPPVQNPPAQNNGNNNGCGCNCHTQNGTIVTPGGSNNGSVIVPGNNNTPQTQNPTTQTPSTGNNSGKTDDQIKLINAQIMACKLHAAIDGLGTDEDSLRDSLIGLSAEEGKLVAEQYKALFGKSLEDAIKGDTSGKLETQLLDALAGKYDNGQDNLSGNIEAAFAEAFYDSGRGKSGTDEKAMEQLLKLISNGSVDKDIANNYYTAYDGKKDIDGAIKAETSGKTEANFLALGQKPFDENSGDTINVDLIVTQLNKAMKGWGTDEEALKGLLIGLTTEEAAQVKAAYESKYGKSLEKAIKSETSGQLEKTLLEALAGGTATKDNFNAEEIAKQAYNAMKGWGTDEEALRKALIGLTPEQANEVKQVYADLYGKGKENALEKAIKGDTSGQLEKILLSAISGETATNKALTSETAAAQQKATQLHAAMKGAGTDEEGLKNVLLGMTSEEAALVKEQYKSMYGKDLDAAIKSETSGQLEKTLLSATQGNTAAKETIDAKAIAKQAYNAMKGWGTDEDSLKDALIGLTPEQAEAVKKAYKDLYSKDLIKAVKGDTSGQLQKMLLKYIDP